MTQSVLQKNADKLRELSVELEGLMVEGDALIDEANRLQEELNYNKLERIRSNAAIDCVQDQISIVKQAVQGLLDA